MSKICAVICELNPLHNGHKHIFEAAHRFGETVVAVMSGNFVQRGECAVFDKYSRAKSALMCGADLVLELPFPWSSAPAENFAAAGIHIAGKIGADTVLFGSECGDIELLYKAAELYESNAFEEKMTGLYGGNTGYAEARQTAIKELTCGDEKLTKIFSDSNDMLALEYIKSAKRQDFNGNLLCEKRIENTSATEIRKLIDMRKYAEIKKAIPDEIHGAFDEAILNKADTEHLFYLEYLYFRTGKIPKDTFDSASGIIERLVNSAEHTKTGVKMLEAASTKKYTDARIRRAALFALTDVTKKELDGLPMATVVLGLNEKGREVLASMRRKHGFKIITKPSSAIKGEASAHLQSAVRADKLYTMCTKDVKEADYYLKQSPVVLS